MNIRYVKELDMYYSTTLNEEDTNTDLWGVLCILLIVPEGICFLVHFYNVVSKSESRISMMECFKNFYPILILDILTAASNSLLLLIVYPSVPSYIAFGCILSSLLVPGLVSVGDSLNHIIKGKSYKKSNLLLDVIGVICITITYILTLICYFTDSYINQNDIVLTISVIVVPLFSFSNVLHTWVYSMDYLFANQYFMIGEKNEDKDPEGLKFHRAMHDYELNKNGNKISFMSSFLRLLTYGILLIIIYYLDSDTIAVNATFYSSDHYAIGITVNIFSSFILCMATLTGLQLGGYSATIPIFFGTVFAELWMFIEINRVCSQAQDAEGGPFSCSSDLNWDSTLFSSPDITMQNSLICGNFDAALSLDLRVTPGSKIMLKTLFLRLEATGGGILGG